MACLNGDGTLTVVAGKILGALAASGDATAVASATGLPLYRVRSGLREMAANGLVEAIGDSFRLTSRGRELLGSSAPSAF